MCISQIIENSYGIDPDEPVSDIEDAEGINVPELDYSIMDDQLVRLQQFVNALTDANVWENGEKLSRVIAYAHELLHETLTD